MHKLLQGLLNTCAGSDRCEVALSLVLLFADCLEENDASVDVDIG